MSIANNSLHNQYKNIEYNYKQIIGEIPILNNNESYDSLIDNTIELIRLCKQQIQSESLFSKNEEFDDYSTSSIKFLYLDYYLAKIYSSIHNISKRKEYLIQSKSIYELLLNNCINLKIIKEEEVAESTENEINLNTEQRRNRKITNYKRNKETNERIKYLENILKSNEDKDNDEELRELLELKLISYARDSMNEINLINQEIELLSYQDQLEDNDTVNRIDSEMSPPIPGQGPGLSITRLNKIGDQIVSTRENIRANVFVPRMGGPTMSLEEYGDRIKAEAEERAKQPVDADPGIRRYKQLVDEGKEDDVDLVDQATLAEREWDAFKEANPRGSGNKMGKRY